MTIIRSVCKFYVNEADGSVISIRKEMTDKLKWTHRTQVIAEYDTDTNTLKFTPLDTVMT